MLRMFKNVSKLEIQFNKTLNEYIQNISINN